MRTVSVAVGQSHADRSYDVLIEPGLMAQAGERLLAQMGKPSTVMLISDDTVMSLYGAQVTASLENGGFTVHTFAFPHGEEQKSLATWQAMLSAMAEKHLTRTDRVVALGGGVTGDMAGFAAASYLRGIAFVQIPTTLLSMVDSSVGGKTGVNLPAGKNLAGAFHQPSLVLCDPAVLSTLPRDTLLDGVAEAVKMGVLGDEELFGWFEEGDFDTHMEDIIQRCVAAKAQVVAEDELDKGNRQLLNLGHTLGHAIEKLSGFGISHGHAVAIGMVYAARLAYKLGLCQEACLTRIKRALEKCGLPVSAPYTPEALCAVALSDKKRAGASLTLILPEKIGKCALYPIPVEDMERLTRLAVEE